ncbi:MAG: phosphate ABC transporter permease PstA [Candidatus Riflebacteria bacterium]|nr:phosphate ABC transporter permease PstA [Candidatus Riflebacteria bacterium]
MTQSSRKLIDQAFTAIGIFSSVFLVIVIIVLLFPIFMKGLGAFFFRGTIEFRKMEMELFERGDREELKKEILETNLARLPVFESIKTFKAEISGFPSEEKKILNDSLKDLEISLRELFGPLPGEPASELARNKFGPTRWDQALVKLQAVLYREEYDYSDTSRMGQKKLSPRSRDFAGTSLETLFPFLEQNVEKMFRPNLVFYWRFFTDESKDTHFFGGIGPEVVGTIYLTMGAMIFAVPMGILSAIFLTEYSRQNWYTSILRTLISTLSGVPSVVFGLFGLAFFINTIHVSQSKSVLAGSLTLAILILPTIIRSSEEAILSVPKTYREAALSLGASPWEMIVGVVLPAALPGILTGIILSMGRAAGETAPIIFTAAVSLGEAPKLLDIFSQPTPALSWNIYNLATEHQKVDQIRHVQYGMVLTLILIVLTLNCLAIWLRNRYLKKLKG